MLTYPAAVLLGFGVSAMSVNALSFATELIGDNKVSWLMMTDVMCFFLLLFCFYNILSLRTKKMLLKCMSLKISLYFKADELFFMVRIVFRFRAILVWYFPSWDF